MGDRQADFDRLLAGEIDADDPTYGQVAAFLGRVQASAELPSVATLEDAHVARIRAALPTLGTVPRTQRRERRAAQLRRLVLAILAGVFGVLTAGVGVAAAMGVNPIDVLSHVKFLPAPVGPVSADPTGQHGSEVPSPPRPSDVPNGSTAAQQSQNQSQSQSHGQSASEHGKPTTDHGRSSEHANPHSSNSAKSTPGAQPSKSKAKPTTGKPTAKNTKNTKD